MKAKCWKIGALELWCWKRPWCWERLKTGGEGDDKGQDDLVLSLTQWTWIWENSGRWWRTGKQNVKYYVISLIHGEGKGYPLQCSDLENSMDCIVHVLAKSQTWLVTFTFTRLVIAFLSRRKPLLISWLQSPTAVILEPKKINSVIASLFPPLFAMKWWDQMPWS